MKPLQRVSPLVGGGPAALYPLLRIAGLALILHLAIAPAANAQDNDPPPTVEQFIGGIVAFVVVMAWILFWSWRRPGRRGKAAPANRILPVERRLPEHLRRLLLWNPTWRRTPPSRLSRQRRRAFLRRR